MKYYSNEIVFRGHPDKVCDQISAALLKEYVLQDKYTRAGIEVMGGKGKIFVAGEVTSKAKVNVKKVVKRVLSDIGYSAKYKIINNIGNQSCDIAQGVDVGGAGDQCMMFGYACNDTPQKLPTAMVILQEFAEWYDNLRKEDSRFLPDGKAQITGEYDDNFKLLKIKDFTVSYQNTEVQREETDKIIIDYLTQLCHSFGIDEIETFHINPTGKFLIGGFEGDAGLTGRKIVVDAYQSFANEVQLSYAIGMDKPLAIYIDSNKGNINVDDNLYDECKPKNIIKDLGLLNVDYEELAKFGHFRT